jgi:YbbR domain-containing protein
MNIFIRTLGLFFITLLFASCSTNTNEVSKEEMLLQEKATNALTEILFDHELDEKSSFEVKEDGFVNLRIQGLVAIKTYTKAIKALRAHKDIKGVHAKKGGVEVCPLTTFVK